MQVCSKKQLWNEGFTSNFLSLWDIVYPTMGSKDYLSLGEKYIMSKSYFPWLSLWLTPTSCCFLTSPSGQEVYQCGGNSWYAGGQDWHLKAPPEAAGRGWQEPFTKFHKDECRAWYLGWSLLCHARGWEMPEWRVALLKGTQGTGSILHCRMSPCLQSKQKSHFFLSMLLFAFLFKQSTRIIYKALEVFYKESYGFGKIIPHSCNMHLLHSILAEIKTYWCNTPTLHLK